MANPMTTLVAVLALAIATPAAATDPRQEQTMTFRQDDYLVGAWWLYKSAFIEGGRVIDRSNRNVSHSEGQGYGMLIAIAADDRDAFEELWAWTRSELYVGENGLAAWKWDPAATPHITDPNNASDGDLLVAWALVRAAEKWGSDDYRSAAAGILDALADHAVIDVAGYGPVLLPGVSGFDAASQPDGPVINLSYWVFPALAEIGKVKSRFPAQALIESGKTLIERARFGTANLPADWLSLKTRQPQPAINFAANFGFEAVRIPLYAAWNGPGTAALLMPVHKQWNREGENEVRVIELATATDLVAMPDPGYRAVSELLSCSLRAKAASNGFETFEPTQYYPSTLHLLSIIATYERYPACLPSLN